MHVYYRRYLSLLKTIFGLFEKKPNPFGRNYKQNGAIILRLSPHILFCIVLESTICDLIMYLFFLF